MFWFKSLCSLLYVFVLLFLVLVFQGLLFRVWSSRIKLGIKKNRNRYPAEVFQLLLTNISRKASSCRSQADTETPLQQEDKTGSKREQGQNDPRGGSGPRGDRTERGRRWVAVLQEA